MRAQLLHLFRCNSIRVYLLQLIEQLTQSQHLRIFFALVRKELYCFKFLNT